MALRKIVTADPLELTQVAGLVNDAIRPLLRLDKDGQTTDYDVAVALSALAQVAGGLLANKSDGEDDKLISIFWTAVTTSTRDYRELIQKMRQHGVDEGG